MLELLTWLEDSALGESLRSSGVWTYGLINLGHIAGIGTLFGSVLILDLRLIGLWRRIPLDTVTQPTVPLAVIGFVGAAVTGICMLSFNAGEYYGNPFLLIKFPAMAVALANAAVVSRMPAWREKAIRGPTANEDRYLGIAGAVSLVGWTVTLAAGRMIGYW